MSITLPERDWKYLKAIKDELLADLCRDINRTAAQILEAGDITDYDKYLKLYRHMENSDRVIAECFDDWRRSTLWIKVVLLRKHKLLSKEHLKNLSSELRDRLVLLYPNG